MTLEHEPTVSSALHTANSSHMCRVVKGRLYTAVRLLVLFLPVSYAMLMRLNKAEIAVHGCHYLGDMAVRMPDHGLAFECVTCF